MQSPETAQVLKKPIKLTETWDGIGTVLDGSELVAEVHFDLWIYRIYTPDGKGGETQRIQRMVLKLASDPRIVLEKRYVLDMPQGKLTFARTTAHEYLVISAPWNDGDREQ